jgi:hypothetical protein
MTNEKCEMINGKSSALLNIDRHCGQVEDPKQKGLPFVVNATRNR